MSSRSEYIRKMIWYLYGSAKKIWYLPKKYVYSSVDTVPTTAMFNCHLAQ